MIDAADYRAYYDVIANQTLWFCLHDLWDLPRRPRFDRHWWSAWERFRAVNAQFAAAAAEAAAPGATVLVHDYQLALVPEMLAARRPDLRTAAFLHTPWCSPGELATLPDAVASELLAGLAGGGACGFHSARWAEAFEACCRERLGRTPVTFVSPAATDVDDLPLVAASPECEQELDPAERRRRRSPPDRSGRPDRAVEERPRGASGPSTSCWSLGPTSAAGWSSPPWSTRPGWAWPSTWPTGRRCMALAEQINAKWSAARAGRRSCWIREDNHPKSVAALRRSDVLLVNPIRDGLNLVAKEGPLVNERDGVLVLSHQAGAWDELGGQAIGRQPLRCDRHGPGAGRRPRPDARPSGRPAPSRCARWPSARSPLDWFDDQRAAARRP